MKALILNSGIGKRMGEYTAQSPKCMVPLLEGETILERQLRQLQSIGIKEAVITTGPYPSMIESLVESLNLSIRVDFINNPKYDSTNYIYSIYLARKYIDTNIILMHGDLVFEEEILRKLVDVEESSMAISTSLELPEKDFKAVIEENRITKVGIEFFKNAVAAQPLYYLKHKDWKIWLNKIVDFCEEGIVECYAENALNLVTDQIFLAPFDFKEQLCQEVDKEEDLLIIREKLKKYSMR